MATASQRASFGVENFGIGTKLTLRTTLDEQISGSTVLAFDINTNCLLLREPGAHNGVATLRILNVPFIKEIVSAEKPGSDFKDPLSPIPYVDKEKCKKREERALQQAELEASRVGNGVTKEAQAIFDALVKTMPCRWQDKSIVVFEEVLVSEPYTPEAATLPKPDEAHTATLKRVQKVLSAERERLGL